MDRDAVRRVWLWFRDPAVTAVLTLVGLLIAAAGLAVAIRSQLVAAEAKAVASMVSLDIGSTTINNFYSIDGAPGVAEPTLSSSCGDAESEVVGGWGPDRPAFVLNHPPSYTTLNGIRDNPNIGDERGFMRVRNAEDGSPFGYEQKVERGGTYLISIYIENSTIDDAVELASTNTRVAVNLPGCSGERIASGAFITSDTAFPREIWGGVTFVGDEVFNLAYVEGSARIESNAWPGPDGYAVSSDLFTSAGVPLGYEEMNGVVLPGYQYSMYLSFEVRAQFSS